MSVRHRVWPENPVESFPTIRVPQHLPKPFTPPEVQALLSLELPPAERRLRALLFGTGRRIKAICNLRLDDISFDPPHLRVVTKGERRQTIPLHASLATLLQAHVAELRDAGRHDYLLRGASGGGLRVRGAQRIVEK